MDADFPITRAWLDVGALEDVPRRGARVIRTARGDIAIFRAADDALFALDDKCPHSGGPLSQGIVQGHAVSCPLHNWLISLENGQAQGADQGCVRAFAVELRGGRIMIALAGPGLGGAGPA